MSKNNLFYILPFLAIILNLVFGGAKANQGEFSETARLGKWRIELIRETENIDRLSVKKCGGLAICKINETPFFYGVSIQSPKSVLASLIITNEESRFQLDVTDMYSARVSPRKKPEKFYKITCDTESSCILRAIFGDAGNAYVVEWQIKDDVSRRTIIADMKNEDVVKTIYDSILEVNKDNAK